MIFLPGFFGTEGKCVNKRFARSLLVLKLQLARVSVSLARDSSTWWSLLFAHAGLLRKIKTRFKRKDGFAYSCPHVTVTDLKVRFSINAKSFTFFFSFDFFFKKFFIIHFFIFEQMTQISSLLRKLIMQKLWLGWWWLFLMW